MITSLNCFEHILKIEPEFVQMYDDHLKEWGSDTNVHSQMSEFSYFVKLKLRQGNYSNLANVLDLIEFILSDSNVDEKVQNAACTCFLENLINTFSNDTKILNMFIPLLGEKSKDYCRGWDEFTKVITPGLWD